MAVLVACKTDEDWIKSEVAIVWTTLSPFNMSIGKFFIAQGQVTKKKKYLRSYSCPHNLQV